MCLANMVIWHFTIGLFMETILLSGDVSAAVLGPVVSAKAGSFEGITVKPLVQGGPHVNAFLGIPYAEPPIGPERFNKPKPFHFISGTYKATTKPPFCLQLDGELYLLAADRNSSMGEDCLYLNVWTPKRRTTDERLKPVMVWIYGGSYSVGSSAMDLYDGRVISALGDVVVVTMNYRLCSLGFLNSLTDDAPGNQALYDQLLALQWVQTNVEYFGGDPKRVTLFGESSGAVSASLLALSPLAHGLFQRMILQSGSSYGPFTQNPSSGVEKGNILAGLVGCANKTFTLSSDPKPVVNCLREVPGSNLTKTYYKEHDSGRTRIDLTFQPQFWDDFLPNRPIDTYMSKNYTRYDLFVGVTQVEGSSLFAGAFPEEYQLYVEGKIIINKTFAIEMLKGLLKPIPFVHPEKVTDYYFKDVGEDQQSNVRAVYEAIGDFVIVCPLVYLAEKYSERGAQVQFYRFDHRPSTSQWPEWMGATHFEEMEFVFGLPFRYSEKYQDGEKELSEYMIRTWTNFAKSEPLTLKNGSPWPNYSRCNPTFATFQTGRQQIIGCGERKTQCEFWRPYFDTQ